VPLRETVPGFDATEYATVPGLLPDPPPVMVIHAGTPVTLQAQPAGAATVAAPVPPSSPNVRAAGEIVIVQRGDGSLGESQLAPARHAAATRTPALSRLTVI
jgi:hypothetical protein